MELINLSDKKLESKKDGRFQVTIKTIEPTDSILVSYEIKVKDYGEGDGYVSIYQKSYSGSNPEKIAQQMVDGIKRKKVTKTKVYYLDWLKYEVLIMGYYDTRNEARRISKLASQNISNEQTKKEFELDSQSKFNQEMQAEFHERIKKLGGKENGEVR